MLISAQQLPVRHLGKVFAKKSLTHQSSDDQSGDDGAPDGKQLMEKAGLDKYWTHPLAFQMKEVVIDRQVLVALHKAQHLMSHFVPDILTPPPNIG